MKIGVWLDTDYKLTVGGGFSYYDVLIQALDTATFDKVELCFIVAGDNMPTMNKEVIQLQYHYKAPIKWRIGKHIPLLRQTYIAKIQHATQCQREQQYIQILQAKGVKVIYYPKQGECALPSFPFIATNWDIGHCSTFTFPELTANGEYERRFSFYEKVLPKALAVFAESEAGKQELVQYTHINPDRIHIVPIFAGNVIKQQVKEEMQKLYLQQYELQKNTYFFYPAQFWAHKNHIALLNAFSAFREQHPEYKLVLTGSDKGNLNYVKQYILQLGLTDAVQHIGFVENEVLYTLYKNATALVMVSFFGPTNMPPLEAMELGCPVVCTDLAGHKESLGDAAIYFSAKNENALVAALEEVTNHNDVWRERIIEQSHQTNFTLSHALEAIALAFNEVVSVRESWS